MWCRRPSGRVGWVWWDEKSYQQRGVAIIAWWRGGDSALNSIIYERVIENIWSVKPFASVVVKWKKKGFFWNL